MNILFLYLGFYLVYHVNVSISIIFQKGYMAPHMNSIINEGLHNYKRQFFDPSKFGMVKNQISIINERIL